MCLQRDKHFVFEDPKLSSGDVSTTATSTQDWLDTLDRAKDMGVSQSIQNSYSGDEAFKDLSSALSSHANTLDRSSEFAPEPPSSSGRATLTKHHSGADSDSIKGRKRFSKRQSKSGLAAVF